MAWYSFAVVDAGQVGENHTFPLQNPWHFETSQFFPT